MNTARPGHLKKLAFYVASALITTSLFQSCAHSMEFLTSSIVPAAEGSVKIKIDKNNNYKIELKVIRLAAPTRLDPQKNVYVVWMKTEQNGIKNIGELKTSGHMLSKMLKSSLITVTPYKPSGFFITAENDANISDPIGQVVLSTGTR